MLHKDKSIKICIKPKTVLEAVESLEEFLVADFGQKDWSPKFLKSHFDICKKQIKEIQSLGKKGR